MSTTFSPTDTDSKIYIGTGIDLQSILALAKTKWPNTLLEDIEIGSEYIQTQCLGYDLYDSSDYTSFITIENRTVLEN